MDSKKYISLVIATATLASIALTSSAFALTEGGRPAGMSQRPGKGVMMSVSQIVGSVTAVSGNTVTVSGKQGVGAKNAATATFSVDATNAKITKNNVAGTIASILVGDEVMIQGKVTGTNVAAKMIRDGVKPADRIEPVLEGNGQPVVAGSVTAVSGNTITITNKSNITYTIDATGAKFLVRGVAMPTISNVAPGDMVVAQGTVNGNAVVATSIIDEKQPAAANTPAKPQKMGFMQGMKGFFAHLFGF